MQRLRDRGFGVLTEEYAAELRRPHEKRSIVEMGRSVFLASKYVHAAEPEALRHGQRHVVIHVETKRQPD